MEEKICKCCGLPKPLSQFRHCCDAYTNQKRWTRNTCKSCEGIQRMERRMRLGRVDNVRQFTC